MFTEINKQLLLLLNEMWYFIYVIIFRDGQNGKIFKLDGDRNAGVNGMGKIMQHTQILN